MKSCISLSGALLLVLLLNTCRFSFAQEYGGTAICVWQSEPYDLNPLYRYNDRILDIMPNCLDRLVQIDAATGELSTGLAYNWEASSDAKTYTFDLYQNVSWHDGVKFTSADVKWTYEEVVDKKGFPYEKMEIIESIETPDDYTLIITLSEPNAVFITDISGHYSPMILPKHIYEGTDWTTNPYNHAPIGTGPFKFSKWERGSYIEFVANEDYFKGRPGLDKLIFEFILEPSVMVTALRNGEVNWLSNVPTSDIPDVQADPNTEVDFVANTVPIWLGFNLRKAPMNDTKVRRAIAYAIDRKDIVDKVWPGVNAPSNGTFLELDGHWAFNPDTKLPDYSTDMAETLLDEAGYPKGADGFRFSLHLVVPLVMGVGDVGPVMKEHLRQVGIDVTLENTDWSTFVDKVINNHLFDIALAGGQHGPDPNEWRTFISTTGTRNMMGYSNAEVDNLLDQARSTFILEERKEYYYEIQEILLEEMPSINICEYVTVYGRTSSHYGFWYQIKGAEYPGFYRCDLVYVESVDGETTTTWIEQYGLYIAIIAVIASAVGGAILLWKRKART